MPRKTIAWWHVPVVLALLAACTGAPTQPAPTQTALSPAPTSTSKPQPLATPGTSSQANFIDDFENNQTSWAPGKPPNYPDSSALTVALTDQHVVQGQQALELSFNDTADHKATFTYEGQFDLSTAAYLEFDLFNPGSLSGVAISLSTGDSWEWFESGVVPLEAGQQIVSFELKTSTYKATSSNWQNSARVSNLAQTQRIAVILFTMLKGSAVMDGLRLVESASGKLPVVVTLPTATPIIPRAASTLKLIPQSGAANAYQVVEFTIETDGVYDNPFDPAEVDLKVQLTAPDDQEFMVPAFWAQDYDIDTRQPKGPAGWRARFTPTQSGEWTARAVLSALQSEMVSLTVQPAPDNRGFVRLHPTNPRYFAFENGETFFPVGINIGWGGENVLADYTRWLDGMQANGGNIIRVWMASWSFGLEWNDTGLGDYSNRLGRAWLLDHVFKLAEARGIYIELVLLNHGAFSASVNPEWENNPYNAANGGPCQKPQDFATDPAAKQYFKNRLRYIAARWAYSPNLMAWEWWNESDWTPIRDPEMAAWIQEMTPVLRGYDPYTHLISTSFAQSSRPLVSNISEIDFAQVHLYSPLDPALNFPDMVQKWSQEIPGKPVLFAEFGADAGLESPRSADRQGLHLHNGLWGATFSGFASGAMYWWWDSYVDPLNLWGVYSGLTFFLQGEDLALMQPVKVVNSSTNVPTQALGNEARLLLWLHDRQYETQAIQRARDKLITAGKKPADDWVYLPEPLSGLEVTINTLKDGQYRVYWYDPTSAKWLDNAAFTVIDGTATLDVPAFQGDLAARIQPADQTGPE